MDSRKNRLIFLIVVLAIAAFPPKAFTDTISAPGAAQDEATVASSITKSVTATQELEGREQAARKTLSTSPKDATSLESLRQIDAERKALAASRDAAVAKYPTSARVLKAAADQAIQAGDLKVGQAYADRAVSLSQGKGDPKELASALGTRALGSLSAKDYTRAAEDAARALKIAPNDRNALSIHHAAQGRTAAMDSGTIKASKGVQSAPDIDLHVAESKDTNEKAKDIIAEIKQKEEKSKKNPVISIDATSTKVDTPGPLKEILPIIKKSKTLTKIYNEMVGTGFTFVYGKTGEGTYIDKNDNHVVIDPEGANNLEILTGLVSHEMGHSRYQNASIRPNQFQNKNDYVQAYVKDLLNDEAEATLVSIEVERELSPQKIKVTVPGVQASKYEKIYDKYPKSEDRMKAREEIGEIFASGEHPSTLPSKTYDEYYRSRAAAKWDRAHPPVGGK